MQHPLCVCSQIPLGHWEKPVEKMEEEILCVSAGMCFITSVPLLMEAVPPIPIPSFHQVLCISIFIVRVKISRAKYTGSFPSSITAGTRLKPFLFLSPLCELPSARLCWIVTCLRAKSWQAAWLSKGPALAAKRAHITRPPVARSYGYSKWQTKVNTLTLFIYLSVRLRGDVCMPAKTISPCPVCVSECQCVGRKICRNALFAFWVFSLFCCFRTFYLCVCFFLLLLLHAASIFTQMRPHFHLFLTWS